MDANSIAYLITNVGFAIFVALCCMYYIREQNKDAREERKELLNEAREERKELNAQMSAKIDALTNLVCALSVDADKIQTIDLQRDREEDYGD